VCVANPRIDTVGQCQWQVLRHQSSVDYTDSLARRFNYNWSDWGYA